MRIVPTMQKKQLRILPRRQYQRLPGRRFQTAKRSYARRSFRYDDEVSGNSMMAKMLETT